MALLPWAFTGCDNEEALKEKTDQQVDVYKNKKMDITYDYNNPRGEFELRSAPGSWNTTLTPLPQPTEGASVANVGDKIIVALGTSLGDHDWTRIYDILTDTWTMGSPAPGTSSEGAGTSHGGLFYNVGGRGAGYNALWSYDPLYDIWAVLPAMPTSRAGLAVATVGNNIYAIGGRTNTGGPNSGLVLNVVEKYDIDAGTWTTVAPLLRARSDLAAVAHGGKIYVLGGFNSLGQPMAALDVYDPVTDSWSAAPANMPTPRGGLYAAGIKGGTIFAIGGWDGTFPFPLNLGPVEAYKISKDKWSTGYTPMPTARGEAGVVSHGGRIYMVGGGAPAFGSPINSFEVFKP